MFSKNTSSAATETPAPVGRNSGSGPLNPATASENAEEKKGRLEPSQRVTGHQCFYIFVLDGLGGMTLSAGVNFAIAYVMYTSQDTKANPIRLFQLPNTLAGDAAVTIIIQCILTWFVEKALVAYDLRSRSVQPIGFISQPTSPLLRWLFFLPSPPATLISTIFQNALRGFMLAVSSFILLWPIGVGALTAFGEKEGGDWGYSDRWTPQFFKFVLGGLLGLLTTPLMAVFWLIKAGWEAEGAEIPETESA